LQFLSPSKGLFPAAQNHGPFYDGSLVSFFFHSQFALMLSLSPSPNGGFLLLQRPPPLSPPSPCAGIVYFFSAPFPARFPGGVPVFFHPQVVSAGHHFTHPIVFFPLVSLFFTRPPCFSSVFLTPHDAGPPPEFGGFLFPFCWTPRFFPFFSPRLGTILRQFFSEVRPLC